MTIGEAIKRARKENGLSQNELAVKCNISRNSILNYESGRRTPNMQTAMKIAEVLNQNFVYFLVDDIGTSEDGEPRPDNMQINKLMDLFEEQEKMMENQKKEERRKLNTFLLEVFNSLDAERKLDALNYIVGLQKAQLKEVHHDDSETK